VPIKLVSVVDADVGVPEAHRQLRGEEAEEGAHVTHSSSESTPP
jgi:hypothetical protein